MNTMLSKFVLKLMGKKYIVCHMLAKVGGNLMELKTNIVPLGVKSFLNGEERYIINPSALIWSKKELHLYYLKGNPQPLTFNEVKIKRSAELLHAYTSEQIKKMFLTGYQDKTMLYIAIVGIALAIIEAIVIMILVSKGQAPPVTVYPKPPPV